ASFVPTGGDAKKPLILNFNDAKTDFIQQGFDVKKSFDGKTDRSVQGWAVAGNERQPNWARFQLDKPLVIDEKGGTLTLTIHFQYGGGEYPLGKFRLWATNSPTPLELGLPEDVSTALQVAPASRSKEQQALLAAFYQSRDKERHTLVFKHFNEKKPLPADAQLIAFEAALKTAQDAILEDPKLLELRENMDYSTRQSADRRLTAAQDLTWALINSPSFLFNR
ncbi:MAG: hypothetical protein NWS30_02010, partial [Verrucomicrobiales bacterium]|nr:hypothetical protein [Verrucomicrobiales bacterium]